MTHEEILGMSGDQLSKMTDEELLKYYEPYLKITRPELAEKPTLGTFKRTNGSSVVGLKKGKVNAILEQLGIDLKV